MPITAAPPPTAPVWEVMATVLSAPRERVSVTTTMTASTLMTAFPMIVAVSSLNQQHFGYA